MTRFTSHAATLRRLAVIMFAFAAFMMPATASAAPNLGLDDDGPVRLNRSVTVSGDKVTLGDLFAGHPLGEEKVVAKAPAPGQRMIIPTDRLAELARTYDIDWSPADVYDRTVVYRAGRVVSPAEILAAFKADLVAQGMSTQIGLQPGAQLPTLVVPETTGSPLTVREAYFDSVSKTFSAIAEFPGPDGKPQYLRVRGTGVNTVIVPVLKVDAARPKVITADMIENMEVAENTVRRDTIVDAENLIGKSPKTLVRAGQAIRDAEVARMTLVDIPAPRSDLSRDSIITENSLTWVTRSASELPADVVTTSAYLIGKSPRHVLAANAPIRRSDVTNTYQVTMAVAARDLQRGEILSDENVNWVPTGDNMVGVGIITDEGGIANRITTHPMRAGQPLRAIDVTKPTMISKDKSVTIIYATPLMKLTVRGTAMENGAAHDTIRVANANSKSVVLAEVMDENTVRVVSQQNAMR